MPVIVLYFNLFYTASSGLQTPAEPAPDSAEGSSGDSDAKAGGTAESAADTTNATSKVILSKIGWYG